ncbi:hypothetical protein PGQ11_002624 [Apiospora arundinis]|uniref:Uncharacterized protein n=1 Tax=Apiospora arundinis TaxID=335852 RepID=A0ABR2JIQ1_9PEZI
MSRVVIDSNTVICACIHVVGCLPTTWVYKTVERWFLQALMPLRLSLPHFITSSLIHFLGWPIPFSNCIYLLLPFRISFFPPSVCPVRAVVKMKFFQVIALAVAASAIAIEPRHHKGVTQNNGANPSAGGQGGAAPQNNGGATQNGQGGGVPQFGQGGGAPPVGQGETAQNNNGAAQNGQAGGGATQNGQGGAIQNGQPGGAAQNNNGAAQGINGAAQNGQGGGFAQNNGVFQGGQAGVN